MPDLPKIGGYIWDQEVNRIQRQALESARNANALLQGGLSQRETIRRLGVIATSQTEILDAAGRLDQIGRTTRNRRRP